MFSNLFKIIFLFILSSSLYSNDLEKITLQLNWKNQFEFAGYYAAKEKGFYKDAGLDVTIKEHKDGTNPLATLLNKNSEYAITGPNFINAYLKGEPLVFVANIFKQSPKILIIQKDVKGIKGLKGKKIMGINDPYSDTSVIHTMLFNFGVKKGFYESIPRKDALSAFVDKKVDALVVYNTNETFYLNELGIKYRILNPLTFGSRFYDSNLITTKEEVLKNPNRVKAMKKASIKGWKYALANKDEIINIILEKYNTLNKSKEALEYEASKIEHYMHTILFPIGSIDKSRVEEMILEYERINSIKDAIINYDTLIYSDK